MERFEVVTEVSEPKELTPEDIERIVAKARQILEAMRIRITRMERLSPDDLRVRARSRRMLGNGLRAVTG